MNPYQMAMQLRHLLQQATWGDDLDLVFGANGSVAVFAGLPTEDQIPPGFPWALVGIDSAEMDPDDPDLLRQRFGIMVAAEVAGDRMGELSLIGGAVSGLTGSAGRGLAEVMSRARAAVSKLTGHDGARILVSGVSTNAPQALGRGRHLSMAQIDLEALCTSDPHYTAPQHLRHSGGSWRWYGAHCSARFDFQQFRLVRKAGSTPPSSPSDGTVLYTGPLTSWTGAATTGNTYAIFADYNSRGSGGAGQTVEASSEPEVGAYRVVA